MNRLMRFLTAEGLAASAPVRTWQPDAETLGTTILAPTGHPPGPPDRFLPPPAPHPPMLYSRNLSRRAAAPAAGMVKVLPGAYTAAPPAATPPWEAARWFTCARAHAVAQRYPSIMAVTHEAAAALLGLWTLEPEPDIRVVVPLDGSHRSFTLPPVELSPGQLGRQRVQVRRSRRPLSASELTSVNGIPVTTPLRTALDCACDLPVRCSLPVIDSALRMVTGADRYHRRGRGELSVAQARQLLEDMLTAQGSRRGVVRARAAISLADPLAESPGESLLRWAAAAAGLPQPVSQWEVAGPAGSFWLDLAFPQAHVGWEFDGVGKYTQAQDLRSEKQRELHISRQGWSVHRFMWRDTRNPHRLVELARTAYRGSLPEDPARDVWL